MADHELSYIDENCEMELTVVRYLASSGENNYEESFQGLVVFRAFIF